MKNKVFKYYLQFIYNSYKNTDYKLNCTIKYSNILLLYSGNNNKSLTYIDLFESIRVYNITSFKHSYIQFKLYSSLVKNIIFYSFNPKGYFGC